MIRWSMRTSSHSSRRSTFIRSTSSPPAVRLLAMLHQRHHDPAPSDIDLPQNLVFPLRGREGWLLLVNFSVPTRGGWVANARMRRLDFSGRSGSSPPLVWSTRASGSNACKRPRHLSLGVMGTSGLCMPPQCAVFSDMLISTAEKSPSSTIKANLLGLSVSWT